MSTRQVRKAIAEAVERTLKPGEIQKDITNTISDEQQAAAELLEDIRLSLRMVHKFCKRVYKDPKAGLKDKLEATDILMKVAERSRKHVASTIAYWRQLGVQPPRPAPLRRPPDLSIPQRTGGIEPITNGKPEPAKP